MTKKLLKFPLLGLILLCSLLTSISFAEAKAAKLPVYYQFMATVEGDDKTLKLECPEKVLEIKDRPSKTVSRITIKNADEHMHELKNATFVIGVRTVSDGKLRFLEVKNIEATADNCMTVELKNSMKDVEIKGKARITLLSYDVKGDKDFFLLSNKDKVSFEKDGNDVKVRIHNAVIKQISVPTNGDAPDQDITIASFAKLWESNNPTHFLKNNPNGSVAFETKDGDKAGFHFIPMKVKSVLEDENNDTVLTVDILPIIHEKGNTISIDDLIALNNVEKELLSIFVDGAYGTSSDGL